MITILNQLERTFAATALIVDGINPQQLTSPTPCRDWNVARLLAHTIGALDGFAARQPNPGAVATLDSDPAAQFRSSAAGALRAWQAPGALDGALVIPNGPSMPWIAFAKINFIDTFAHGWDLARATDQVDKIDQDLAAACLETAQAIITDESRQRAGIDPALSVDANASPANRLAGFLGRAFSNP